MIRYRFIYLRCLLATIKKGLLAFFSSLCRLLMIAITIMPSKVKSRYLVLDGGKIMSNSVFQMLYCISTLFTFFSSFVLSYFCFIYFFHSFNGVAVVEVKLHCTLSQVWTSECICVWCGVPKPIYRCANLLNINHITKHHIAIIIVINIIAPSAS